MRRPSRAFQGLPAAFVNIWAAHTVSQVGTQVTLLALPLTAVLLLKATPLQMGLLAALGRLPSLLFSLPAGVWVDRWDKRRVLVTADLARVLLLALVPVLALLHTLNLPSLLIIAFLVDTATVFFEVAAAATTPVILGRAELLRGNALLEASRSTASLLGPSLAGALVGLIGAPVALTLDALSFLASALFLRRLHTSPTTQGLPRRAFWQEAVGGLREIASRPLLAALVRTSGLWNFFVGLGSAVQVLFLTRLIGLTPVQLGVTLTLEGLGMLAGTASIGPAQRRLPLGAVLMLGGLLAAASAACIVAVQFLPPPWRFPALLANEFLSGLGYMIFAIGTSSCRQAATPDDVQGRVSAAFRFVILGGLPLGALLGGWLGSQFSLATTLLSSAGGMSLAWALLLPTAVPRLRALPRP